jgi:hypothetical protein
MDRDLLGTALSGDVLSARQRGAPSFACKGDQVLCDQRYGPPSALLPRRVGRRVDDNLTHGPPACVVRIAARDEKPRQRLCHTDRSWLGAVPVQMAKCGAHITTVLNRDCETARVRGGPVRLMLDPSTVLAANYPATRKREWMYSPVLFRDRARPMQILIGGVVPAVIGAIAGVLVGVSSAGYWVVAVLAAIGSVVAGFEHRDGWGGADRGFFGGAIYGTALLVAHALAGTHAKVSLGSFPPLLAVVTTIIGMFLCAAGGRIARALRERAR